MPAGYEEADFYELLNVPRDIEQGAIRKAYYKVARECHPDKHGGDPRAEARFKAVSMAYEVLNDPAKRKLYDEHGREGLEGHVDMSGFDIQQVIRSVFGGGAYDNIFGDICTLPTLKMVIQSMGSDGKLTEHPGANPAQFQAEEKARLAAEEEAYCQELAVYLLSKLEMYSMVGFQAAQRAEAEGLVQAPGGQELLGRVAYVYIQEAKQYVGNIFAGFFSELQEKAHFASEGASVVASAMGLFVKAKELERRQLEASGVNANGQPLSAADRMRVGRAARSDEQVREQESKLMDEGLSTVWKLGKLMVEERVRRVVEIVMDKAKKGDKQRYKALGNALLIMGEEFERVAEEEAKRKEFDLRNHIVVSAAQASDPGAPPQHATPQFTL